MIASALGIRRIIMKIKRLFSLLMAAIMIATLCISNINSYAFIYSDNMPNFNEDNFTYCIDIETSSAAIVDIKAGTRVLNIPETVVCNGITYPVKYLAILNTRGYSLFTSTLQTINVSKNIESIGFNFQSSSGYYDNLSTLKTINVPSGSKLKELFLPPCPKLSKLYLPSDSVLENICIGGCPKLTKLSLPKTLKYCSLGEDAPKLKVKIAKGNKYLKVKGNQILSKDGKKLIDIVGNKSKITVYKTVKIIYGVFENKYLKKLIIGQNVTKFSRYSLNTRKKLNIVLKHKNKAPKIKKYSIWQYDIKGINFYVQNKKVAKDLKKKLKAGGIEKARILIGKKVIYKIENYWF